MVSGVLAFLMLFYGKMQESGPTNIISLTLISAIWGQFPMFFHVLSFLSAHRREWCDLMAVLLQALFFPGALRVQKSTFGGWHC